jgi:hypothetical protein
MNVDHSPFMWKSRSAPVCELLHMNNRPNFSSFMKILPLVLLVALTGCDHPESRAQKMGEQISQWVPVGTPLAAAQRIMEEHQFTCSVVSYANAEQMSNSPDAVLWKTIVTRDRQHFAVTNISHLECKSPQCSITFTVVNGEVSGHSAFGRL